MGAVTGLTSLGFCMIGYDNGLMGGLSMFSTLPTFSYVSGLLTLLWVVVVNTPSFLKTFHTPGANVIATIVAIFDGEQQTLFPDRPLLKPAL